MKLIKKSYLLPRVIAIVLTLILIQNGFEIRATDGDYGQELATLIQKFKNDQFDEVISQVEKLLNETGEDIGQNRGKFFLLLGAAYEKKGLKDKAVENYLLGDMLLDAPVIEGIDFSKFEIYQSTFHGKIIKGKRVFEKVGKRKRKKRFPYLALVGAAAITAIVLILFKKKTKDEPENISRDYAEEVFGEIEWIEIPAGEFLMGDNTNSGDLDERPVHKVYLNSYKISKYEITYSQFYRFSEVNYNVRASFSGSGNDHPVVNVNFEEARQFSQWLASMNNKNIKIPTEAQWEKAARGTDQRIYPWGNQPPDCNRTNFYNCTGQTQAVGSFPGDISFYGVMDMGGNVSEWVLDGYLEDYYSISPYSNPTGQDYNDADFWIIRGGNYQSTDCRSSNRTAIKQYLGSITEGLRIVWID